MKGIKYSWDSLTSPAYWQYIFSKAGILSIFSIFGSIYLVLEALDFFEVLTRDKYGSYIFMIIFFISIIVSIISRRPVKTVLISLPKIDVVVEVCIADIFDLNGAVVISTNSDFEADVSDGKIALDSLQGQFTAKYYAGNQSELINSISNKLEINKDSAPYNMGTTIPISTHGKVFYFTVMADMNKQGTASTNLDKIRSSLEGLWKYVYEAGELQELVIPVLGTGRGRINSTRNQMIRLIAESFVKASEQNKFTDKLIIVIRPEDAKKFKVNLYDIKDNLKNNLLT